MSKKEGHMYWKPLNKSAMLALHIGMVLAAVGCSQSEKTFQRRFAGRR
jgi:hypothetical protein